MTSRLGKLAVVLLLGFVLACQGLVPAAAGNHSSPSRSCCGSDCGKCGMPTCCAKPSQPASPLTATPRSASENESQALVLPVAILTLPLQFCAVSCDTRRLSFSPVAAVPLFQRDCRY